MENCILFGNGFNQLLGKDVYPSWNTLICDAENDDDAIKKASYPLRFEVALANKRKGILESDTIARKNLQKKLKEIVNGILSSPSNYDIELYTRISDLDFSDFLTTNYDNFLYQYLRTQKKFKRIKQDRTEQTFSLRRRYTISDKKRTVNLWNIHGDVDNYHSMVIGYDQYCGSIWKLNEYINGSNYKYHKHGEKEVYFNTSLLTRIQNRSLFSQNKEGLYTWCDHFFTKNVHIIGIGLSFDEIDIWWLLNRRIRLILDEKVKGKIQNKIYYYDVAEDHDKHIALKAFGVTVVLVEPEYIKRDSAGNITNWKELYLRLVDIMEKNIG